MVKQRAKFNADVLTSLQAGVVGPIAIDGVQVEDIAFSEAYQQGIEAKQLVVRSYTRDQVIESLRMDRQADTPFFLPGFAPDAVGASRGLGFTARRAKGLERLWEAWRV